MKRERFINILMKDIIKVHFEALKATTERRIIPPPGMKPDYTSRMQVWGIFQKGNILTIDAFEEKIIKLTDKYKNDNFTFHPFRKRERLNFINCLIEFKKVFDEWRINHDNHWYLTFTQNIYEQEKSKILADTYKTVRGSGYYFFEKFVEKAYENANIILL